jgi:hypothetical protein
MANEMKEKDIAAYNFGRDFLLDLLSRHQVENPAEVLNKCLIPEWMGNLNDVYTRLLKSLKNRRGMNNYITSIITDINILRNILSGFAPKEVARKYFRPEGWKSVSGDILQHLRKNIDQGKYWSTFCKGIISGADFLSHFKDKDEFDGWYTAPR